MDLWDIQAQRNIRLVTQRSSPLRAVRELWWTHHRRRYIARLSHRDFRHPLDEGYGVDAMARQIEEIRNLRDPDGYLIQVGQTLARA